MSAPSLHVTVIGAGTMGHGIAQVSALAGHQVTLHDLAPAALEKARAHIEENLAGGIRRGKLQEEDRERARAHLQTATDLGQACEGADLVVEAIVENLAVKQRVFAEVEERVGETAILASNTSSLPITQIAAGLRRPAQVVGMHFFNPVHIMKLVEVVVHPGTADLVRDQVVAVARGLGKEPIVVKDSPGFASSRLGVVLGLEAMRMLEQGVASAEDIDKAMVLGYAHPMGPLRLTDLVGLDVRLAIAEYLHGELKDDQYRPPEILRRKVEEGHLGKKSGRGFYDWRE